MWVGGVVLAAALVVVGAQLADVATVNVTSYTPAVLSVRLPADFASLSVEPQVGHRAHAGAGWDCQTAAVPSAPLGVCEWGGVPQPRQRHQTSRALSRCSDGQPLVRWML